MIASADTLYESVAQEMTRLIERGTYRPGDRLPSVRGLARQLDTSITTVVQAYRLLETRGIIEARPQSGFYVRARLETIRRKVQQQHSTPSAPVEVKIEELYMRMMQDSGRPNMLLTSAAISPPEMIPVDKLRHAMTAAIRRWPLQQHEYDLMPGCLQLRQQISQRLLNCGVTAAPEEIVTTCGTQEAIMLALRAICKPGDVVAVEGLAFSGTLHSIEALGLRVVEIPVHSHTGLDLAALQREIDNHQIKAVICVPSFNNPLGCLMTDEAKQSLVRLLSSRKIPLIEDDIYGDISFDPQRPRACKSYDSDGTVIYCSSFSKTITPGYRVGFMIAGPYQSRVERLKLVTNVASPMPTQLAIAEFLETGGYDAHLRKIRRVYKENCEHFMEKLRKVMPEGTRFSEPRGGMVLWVELPTARDTVELYTKTIAERVAIAPGCGFSAGNLSPNAFRLVYTKWNENVEKGLEILGRLSKEFVEK